MKKTIFFIVMGVFVIALTAYLGVQLISNNLPNDSKKGGQDIVKVNVPEKVNETKLEAVQNIMKSMKWSVQQAMDALMIPDDQRTILLKKMP